MSWQHYQYTGGSMRLKWLSYFEDTKKEQALLCKSEAINVEYGDIIYQSSEFLDRRWLVAHYLEEYNVFVEYKGAFARFERLLAATFKSKERAVGFAVEMFLICCGRLQRYNRRSLDPQKIDEDAKLI